MSLFSGTYAIQHGYDDWSVALSLLSSWITAWNRVRGGGQPTGNRLRTASACGFTPFSIICTQVARVSLSSRVFKSCEMSWRAAGAQLGPAGYPRRTHSLSRVSLAEMMCSDSRVDDMGAGCVPKIGTSRGFRRLGATSLQLSPLTGRRWPAGVQIIRSPECLARDHLAPLPPPLSCQKAGHLPSRTTRVPAIPSPPSSIRMEGH